MEVLGEKRSAEWAKSKTGYGRKSDSTTKKNKREYIIEKWDQTDSPDIPDRGKTS